MTTVYSQAILAFVAKAKSLLVNILKNEIGVTVSRNYFHYRGDVHPINLVVVEHPKLLGHFAFNLREIAINKCMLFAKKSSLKDDLVSEYRSLVSRPHS